MKLSQVRLNKGAIWVERRSSPRIFPGWWIVLTGSFLSVWGYSSQSYGFSAPFKPISSELEASLSDRKIELADIETVKGCVEELRNLLESTLITERKSFIKSFVKEVRVTGSEVSLDYTPQLLEGMMSWETFLVPSIVHVGGRYWI